jgi:hypothetical protein
MLRRDAVAQFFAEWPPCVVGMEACSGAHWFLGKDRVAESPGCSGSANAATDICAP